MRGLMLSLLSRIRVWSSVGFCEDGGEHLDTVKIREFFF